MGFMTSLGRVLIVVLNIIFLLIALALFTIGMIIKFGASIMQQYINEAKKQLQTSLSDTGYGDVAIDLDLTQVLNNLAIAFIVFGVVLTLICVCGCCGACYKIKWMLVVYGIIILIFLIGEAVAIGLLFGKPEVMTNPTKEALQQGIDDEYTGFNGTNIVSMGWNIVMIEYKCCGIENSSDFSSATNWLKDYGPGGTLTTPIACCKTLPSSSMTDPNALNCATNPTDELNNWKTGCLDTIWNKVLGNVAIVAGVFAGVMVFELVLILFSIAIFWDAREGNEKVFPHS
ncbi:hypothetical protein ScPMuIL_003190 [Solemya velum]